MTHVHVHVARVHDGLKVKAFNPSCTLACSHVHVLVHTCTCTVKFILMFVIFTCFHSQDLVCKFNSLVMPEVSKCIVSNDPSLVEMLEVIGEIKLTMYPDLPLPDALRKLHEQLKQCALKNMPADLTATAAVDDLKNRLSSIMFSAEEGRGTVCSIKLLFVILLVHVHV